MEEFEKDINNAVRSAILSQIKQTRFLEYNYHNAKSLPSDVINKVWANINWDSIIKEVAEELNNRLAQNIVQSMLTEVKTDTKKLLSVEGVRERLRMEAYPKIMEVLKDLD